MSTHTGFSPGRAQTYDKCVWHLDPILLQWIVEHLSHYGTSICDIGAGTGHLLHPLSSVFAEIVLIEPSLQMLTRLKRRVTTFDNKLVRVYRGVAEKVPLKDHSIDIALSKSVLHHVSDRQRCVHEMARIATKAIAIMEVISPEEVASDVVCMDYVKTLLLRKDPIRGTDSVFSEEDLSTLVSTVASEQRRLHFDQYIDIQTWLECSDLCQTEREQLYALVDTQPTDVKRKMQIHYRSGRLVQHRRMLLVIGVL